MRISLPWADTIPDAIEGVEKRPQQGKSQAHERTLHSTKPKVLFPWPSRLVSLVRNVSMFAQ